MSILKHNFKKDARHLRVPLAFWFLLVALQAGLSGSGITANAEDMVLTVVFQTLAFLVPVLQVVILLVLVPLLIHDEPLVGSTAFWFTRPISRRDLLSSKALFVGLLLVLPPLLAELTVLACNGAAARHVLFAAPEILMERLSLLLLVAVAAAITPNFARFALVAAGCGVAIMLVTFVIYFTRMLINPELIMQQAVQFSLTQSRSVVTSALTIALALAAIWHQYMTRKTRRTVAAIALGYLLVTAVQYVWPWDFFAVEKNAIPASVLDGSRVTVSIDPARINVSDEFRLRKGKAAKKQIAGAMEVQGLPDGYIATPEVTSSSITLPGGKTIDKAQPAFGYFAEPPGQSRDALRHALGDMELIGSDNRNDTTYRGLASIDEQDYLACGDKGLDLSLTVDLRVYKDEITGSMPIKRGARFVRESRQTIVTDVLRQSQGCTLVLQEKSVQVLFDPKCRPATPNQFFGQSEVQYVLCNRKLKQAFLPKEEPNGLFNIFGAQSRLRVGGRTLKFQDGGNSFRPKIDEAWLADAELLCVEKVAVGTLTKTVTAKSLILKDDARMRQFEGGSGSARHKEGPDQEALNKITLPDNPTKEQARTYVMQIVAATEGQCRFSQTDPQVNMLKRIGPDHLDVLLDCRPDMFHVRYAMTGLAGPQHKDLVLANLERWPNLADIVLEQGWAKDARDTLLRGLKPGKDVSSEWLQAVLTLNDPSTYDQLKTYLAKGNNPGKTYSMLKRLPGIDLSSAVADAWRRTKYKESDYEALQMVSAAIEHGHLDALDIGTELMAQSGSNSHDYGFGIRDTVRLCVDTAGSDKDIRDWFVRNKGNLFFDAATKKFKVKP